MKKLLFLLLTIIIPCTSYSGATGEVLGGAAKGAVVGGAVGAVQTKVGQQIIGEKASKGIGEFFDSPPGILTIAGMATVYSGMLYNAASEQVKESDDNIKKIDKIIAEFKDSYVNFCPDGRDSLDKPACYCYLATGAINTNRSKSQICQALWAKDQFKLSAVAGNYQGAAHAVDPVGCLTLSGQFDENCKCKKFLNSQGTNACAKSVSISIPSGISPALVSNSGLKDIMQLAANASNGNPFLNNFKTGTLGVKAIGSDQLNNQLITKLSSMAGGKNGVSLVTEKNVGQLAKAIIGEKNIAAAVARSTSPLSLSSSPDPKTAAILKAAATKAGIDLVGSGHGLQNKKVDSKDAMNFNLVGDSNSNGTNQTQNFPEKEKNYKINDISKSSDTSIFEIISHRYIQSGLKRLFDD